MYHTEKYELSPLKALCEEQLSFDLQIDNAAKILQLADTCNAQQLKQKTLLFNNKHGGEVQLTEEWEGVEKSAELLHDLVTAVGNNVKVCALLANCFDVSSLCYVVQCVCFCFMCITLC